MTKLFLRERYTARQRDTVPFSRKYLITEDELYRRQKDFTETHKVVGPEWLLDGFDPANDEDDRRLLYEVTGLRLEDSEFRDD